MEFIRMLIIFIALCLGFGVILCMTELQLPNRGLISNVGGAQTDSIDLNFKELDYVAYKKVSKTYRVDIGNGNGDKHRHISGESSGWQCSI